MLIKISFLGISGVQWKNLAECLQGYCSFSRILYSPNENLADKCIQFRGAFLWRRGPSIADSAISEELIGIIVTEVVSLRRGRQARLVLGLGRKLALRVIGVIES